jgi:hypothetical protein
MPFQKGDERTKAAGRRGGKSGKKHLSTLTKAELETFSRNAGRMSAQKRRARRETELESLDERIMNEYLD